MCVCVCLHLASVYSALSLRLERKSGLGPLTKITIWQINRYCPHSLAGSRERRNSNHFRHAPARPSQRCVSGINLFRSLNLFRKRLELEPRPRLRFMIIPRANLRNSPVSQPWALLFVSFKVRWTWKTAFPRYPIESCENPTRMQPECTETSLDIVLYGSLWRCSDSWHRFLDLLVNQGTPPARTTRCSEKYWRGKFENLEETQFLRTLTHLFPERSSCVTNRSTERLFDNYLRS